MYAFITRFYPDLRDTTSAQSLLTDVTSLEQALVNSSPPPGSKWAKVAPPPKPNNLHYYYFDDPYEAQARLLAAQAANSGGQQQQHLVTDSSVPGTPADANGHAHGDGSTAGDDAASTTAADDNDEDADADGDDTATPDANGGGPTLAESIPPSSALLIEIIKAFEHNLHLPEFENSHGRRDWFSWLVRFVNKRLAMFGRGGFDWHYNLLKRPGVKSGSEREQEFWLLKWDDKVSEGAFSRARTDRREGGLRVEPEEVDAQLGFLCLPDRRFT